jgi:predicted pyridoxine 5'-phosphate oxidase superfamily flavin-nucleotide-binding protein
MATWNGFANAAKEIANEGRRLFDRYHVAMLATTRADGAPRLQPVAPIIADGRLFVFVNPKTPKFSDLVRDGRYVMHALMDLGVDNEFQIGGSATLIEDAEVRLMVAKAAGYPVLEQDRSAKLFELDIERAMRTTWYHQGRPDTRPIRKRWSA